MYTKKEQAMIDEMYEIVAQLIAERNAKYDWSCNARPEQLVPKGDWRTWLILAGRGFGKTRTGSETIRQWINNGLYRRIALIGNTYKDARDIMVEGESGLLNICPTQEQPIFESSRGRLVWPNGAVAYLYSAEDPEALRGPQFDAAWIDELAKFRNIDELWTQINLALRLGDHPRIVITTTPRSKKLIKTLVNDPDVYVTRGSTMDNKGNLAPGFLKMIESRFKGTRLGAQEIDGDILNNSNKAFWSYNQLDQLRVKHVPDLQRIVIGIDPATTYSETSDETGIIVAGLGYDGRGYVLEDLSGRFSPHEWARRAVSAYWNYRADRIIAETNAGGDLVERVIRSIDTNVSFKSVKATRGKMTRAEPIAALYEQGRISHKQGSSLEKLEQQLCSYIPGQTSKSPDRLDAMVWALTELMLEYGAISSPKAWLI